MLRDDLFSYYGLFACTDKTDENIAREAIT